MIAASPIVVAGFNSERFDGRNLATRLAALDYAEYLLVSRRTRSVGSGRIANRAARAAGMVGKPIVSRERLPWGENFMQTSQARILTTHTGSLPRPTELVDLYLRKNRGEAVDAQLAEAGRSALDYVVRKQHEAGIDIGNNGEQQREAFFLYVRSRMSGFGGAWTRLMRADVEKYPDYKAAMLRDQQHMQMVSSREQIPTAIGDVHYLTAPPSKPR